MTTDETGQPIIWDRYKFKRIVRAWAERVPPEELESFFEGLRQEIDEVEMDMPKETE